MTRRIEQLKTWVLGDATGLLTADPADGWNFTYEGDEGPAIALTMPRTVRTVTTKAIPPPFDQQLPEMDLGPFSPAIWKEVRPDEMGLLLVAGNRRLGRLRFAEPGGSPERTHGLALSESDLKSIDDGDEYLLQVLATMSFVPGIGGIQPKTLVRIGDRPIGDAKIEDFHHLSTSVDTHILKGNRREFPWSTINEHLCLCAAERAKLIVPERTLSKDGKLLAIKRFDVVDEHVLGFDEACALMGLHSADKYDRSFEAMCKQLALFTRREARRECLLTLLRQQTLCYAVENGDAHLKNFGLLYENPDDTRISPTYDILTTTCYPSISRDTPALTLDGRKRWDAFGTLERYFKNTWGLTNREIHPVMIEVWEGIKSTLPLFKPTLEEFPAASDILNGTQAAWVRGLGRMEEYFKESGARERESQTPHMDWRYP